MQRHEIPKLEFRDSMERRIGPFTSMQLKANVGADARYQPYEIELWNSGFHSSRTLSVEELFAVSEWFAARVAEVRAADAAEERRFPAITQFNDVVAKALDQADAERRIA
jgi:hypothetical protein